jgi:CubicO group peptidase (beta-lactamase class C family)
VASVRKSYIGFAVAYALYHGFISSIDDPVSDYILTLDPSIIQGTTIRHLLTHTHGLKSNHGKIEREFLPGQGWAYRGVGIDMLCEIVHKTTGNSIAQILYKQVFDPLEFKETGWYAATHENLVDVIREPNDPLWETFESTSGDKSNMYISARELAYWGYLHLNRGNVLGKQVVPKNIIEMVTSLQSPVLQDRDLPQNGFPWFVIDYPAKRNEIGELVPKGSYQILGYTGVTLLVVPEYRTVAVRMFNSWGSPSGYDYLADVRGFRDCVMQCLK